MTNELCYEEDHEKVMRGKIEMRYFVVYRNASLRGRKKLMAKGSLQYFLFCLAFESANDFGVRRIFPL